MNIGHKYRMSSKCIIFNLKRGKKLISRWPCRKILNFHKYKKYTIAYGVIFSEKDQKIGKQLPPQRTKKRALKWIKEAETPSHQKSPPRHASRYNDAQSGGTAKILNLPLRIKGFVLHIRHITPRSCTRKTSPSTLDFDICLHIYKIHLHKHLKVI